MQNIGKQHFDMENDGQSSLRRKKITKHPIVYGILLFIAALLAAAVLTGLGTAVGLDTDVTGSLARIAVGFALLVLVRHYVAWKRSLTGLRLVLPALAVVVFNIALEALAGMPLRGLSELPYVLLLGIAPAIFEETIFRAAVIGKLRESGQTPIRTLWLSALLFGAVHLTNIAGMTSTNVLVQTLYAVVIGLFLGAVYITSGDFVSVIIAHAAIDISHQLYAVHRETTPMPFVVVFAVLLLGLAYYALRLMSRTKTDA